MHKLPLKVVGYLTLTLFAFVALPSSAAHIKFTYTNQDLYFISHRIEEVPTVIDSTGLPVPSFSLSFTLPEIDLSLQPTTAFFTQQLSLSLNSNAAEYLDFPAELSPSSYAQVSLNPEGQITDWNLVVFATELITPETNLEIHSIMEKWVAVHSNNLTGDQLTHRYHTYTRRQQTLRQAALLEFNYEGNNSLSNWTLERIRVPEPGLAGLFLSGLAILLWRRRAHKNPIR